MSPLRRRALLDYPVALLVLVLCGLLVAVGLETEGMPAALVQAGPQEADGQEPGTSMSAILVLALVGAAVGVLAVRLVLGWLDLLARERRLSRRLAETAEIARANTAFAARKVRQASRERTSGAADD